MNIKLIVSQNCKACERAKETLESINLRNYKIYFETIDIKSYNEKNISITPALIIDDKIFSYGDIDIQKLNKKISGGSFAIYQNNQ
ncbi:MAG: hypothetical protein CO129_00200 [Ignavibacteriales bacterium CG_4_9_14_3_um_filter_34_10]|nr:MAG: hypothetical protein CO129_00200 [Ignavibacteriales bacterium CG_4_9_14_3_um_filter_34_10]